MKIEYKYGITIGALICLWVLGEFWIGTTLNRPDLGEITGFLASIIPIVGITLGLRAKKKQQTMISYKQALISGLMISAIAGFITAIFIFIYMTARPDAFTLYYEYLREILPESGLSAEEVEAQISQYQRLAKPWIQAIYFFVSSLISGFIISGIAGIFLKSKTKKTT